MIRIANKQHKINLQPNEVAIYIGRPSSLGNPFKIGKDGTREEVIAKYENYLYNCIKDKNNSVYRKLKELKQLYDAGKDLVLVCWCWPKRCHAEVIKKAIEDNWLNLT